VRQNNWTELRRQSQVFSIFAARKSGTLARFDIGGCRSLQPSVARFRWCTDGLLRLGIDVASSKSAAAPQLADV